MEVNWDFKYFVASRWPIIVPTASRPPDVRRIEFTILDQLLGRIAARVCSCNVLFGNSQDPAMVTCLAGFTDCCEIKARRPVSRVLSPAEAGGWPFIWDARYRTPRATDPDGDAKTRPADPSCDETGLPSLLGLAPGGVYRAAPVAGDAVRSYRTLSPLPRGATDRAEGRFAFCGTFPRVAPAGRYPAPCFRGARTFLPRPRGSIRGRQRPSGRLAL